MHSPAFLLNAAEHTQARVDGNRRCRSGYAGVHIQSSRKSGRGPAQTRMRRPARPVTAQGRLRRAYPKRDVPAVNTGYATTRMQRKDSAKGQPSSGAQAKALPNGDVPIGCERSGHYGKGDDPGAPGIW